MAYFVYMLRCGDGSLYTGSTNHVPHRLAMHQSGKGAKYTRWNWFIRRSCRIAPQRCGGKQRLSNGRDGRNCC